MSKAVRNANVKSGAALRTMTAWPVDRNPPLLPAIQAANLCGRGLKLMDIARLKTVTKL